MIALISTIIGLLSSLIPSILRILEKRQEFKYELEFRRLELEAATKGIELQARLAQIKAATEQANAIYNHDNYLDGGESINKLRASVRPVITYAFFGIFALTKTALLLAYINSGLPLEKILPLLWDEQTTAFFSMIIAFWFGARMIEKTDIINNMTNKNSNLLLSR